MGIPKRMNVEIRNADFMHVNQNGEVVIRLRLYYETRNRVVYLPELILNMKYRDWETDRKSTRLNSSHITRSRMPSSA